MTDTLSQCADDPRAPEMFVTHATGFLVAHGNVHITFETARTNYFSDPPQILRVVIGRLVMPLVTAQSLVDGLSRELARAARADEADILR